MCGIFGMMRIDGGNVVDEQAIAAGTHQLRHRGPDGENVLPLDKVCFGHTRLAIIDLKDGDQPMTTADRQCAITYNGEIYNYRELRSELEKAGEAFRTQSDTEVVLRAYRFMGAECLTHFRGMFAFAAVDLQKNQAILARDRVGKKPLFYTIKNGVLWFSSELEPLYRTVGPFDLDQEALDEYLSWQYIPAPRTIYRDVHCLLPAHYLSIDLGSGSVEGVPLLESSGFPRTEVSMKRSGSARSTRSFGKLCTCGSSATYRSVRS